MRSSDLERQEVIDYMWSQAADETVTHAEKLTSERVWGTDHDVWDVHTDKSRWWVITGMTNLYSQDDFKSMDGVLTFHLGLTSRMLARQQRKAPSRPDPKLEQTRRQWEQAAEAQNDADEAEEFQAVGMRCRETLVSFAHAMADDELVANVEDRPQLSDFLHWSELIANAVATGGRNRKLRSYLRSEAKETWEYVNWLTHEKNATRLDGEIAVQVTAHFLSIFEQLIHRSELGMPDRCPECGSYKVEEFCTRNEDRGELLHALACGACEWVVEVEAEALRYPDQDDESVEPPTVEGDCTLSSELGPGVSRIDSSRSSHRRRD